MFLIQIVQDISHLIFFFFGKSFNLILSCSFCLFSDSIHLPTKYSSDFFSKISQATNFKEWKQVAQEISRFLKADVSSKISRPLRYNILFDAHPSSFPYIARFHANRVLRLRDALLASYRRNEVCWFLCFSRMNKCSLANLVNRFL